MTLASIILSAITANFQQGLSNSFLFVEERTKSNIPKDSMHRFINYARNGRNAVFSLNQKFWLRDIDFTCVSPWNDKFGSQRAGTAISKRHIVFASHFPLIKGTKVYFVDIGAAAHSCQIIETKPVYGSDIMIGLLDRELAESIKPARILPENYKEYIGNGEGYPLITFNQEEKAILTELWPIGTNRSLQPISSSTPNSPQLAAFRKPIIVGDSGNPAFLLYEGNPILMFCLHGGATGSGPGLHLFRAEIQKVMDDLCPGYHLRSYDFSK